MAASLSIAFIFVLIADTHASYLLKGATFSIPILSRRNRALRQALKFRSQIAGASCRNKKRDAIFDCLAAVGASYGCDSLSRRKRFDKW